MAVFQDAIVEESGCWAIGSRIWNIQWKRRFFYSGKGFVDRPSPPSCYDCGDLIHRGCIRSAQLMWSCLRKLLACKIMQIATIDLFHRSLEYDRPVPLYPRPHELVHEEKIIKTVI